jgi:hypothetical protein
VLSPRFPSTKEGKPFRLIVTPRPASCSRKFIDAGYDHVYVHQIGPDQSGFFRFYRDEVIPKL